MQFLFFLSILFGCAACKRHYWSIENRTPNDWTGRRVMDPPTSDWFKRNESKIYLIKPGHHEPYYSDVPEQYDGLSHAFYVAMRSPPNSSLPLKEATYFPVMPNRHLSPHCVPLKSNLLYKKTVATETRFYQCGMRVLLVPAIPSKSDELFVVNESNDQKSTAKSTENKADTEKSTEPIWLKVKDGTCAHRKESCHLKWRVVGTHDNQDLDDAGEFEFEITIGLTEGRGSEQISEHRTLENSQHSGRVYGEIETPVMMAGAEYAYQRGSGSEDMRSLNDITSRDITRTQTRKFKYAVGAGKKMIAEQEVLICDCFGFETGHVRGRDVTANSKLLVILICLGVLALLICASFVIYIFYFKGRMRSPSFPVISLPVMSLDWIFFQMRISSDDMQY